MGSAGGFGLRGSRNLLAGLGSAVAEQMMRKHGHDAVSSSSTHARRFNKELILDNYNPNVMPGFTGSFDTRQTEPGMGFVLFVNVDQH